MKKLNLLIMILMALVVSMPAFATITHRYDFVADANDVVGGLGSVLVGDAHIADGALVLDGTDDWLELDGPGIAINTYTEGASFEFWFTDHAVTGWTRIFDFGDKSSIEEPYTGGYAWFYTPSGPGNSRLAIATQGFPGYNAEQQVQGPTLLADTQYHIVCVYEPGGGTGGQNAMRIYQDGVQVGANETVTQLLTDVRTNFALIGKALYSADPEMNGEIHEFRIYDKPLSAAEVRFTNLFGPEVATDFALRTMTPADGSDWISTTPTLAWTPESWVGAAATYNLYIGTDPNIADPNKPDLTGYYELMVTGIEEAGYTIPVEDRLTYDASYYWRVDTVDGATVYQGVGSTFSTIPETPAFWVHPATKYAFPDVDETAEFSVEIESVHPVEWIKWYKDDVEITTGIQIDYDGDFAYSTLTISNVTAADAGSYYAKAKNVIGESSSTSAKLVVKQLVAHWEFNDNLLDSSGNGYDGTGMLTTTELPGTLSFTAGVDGAGRSVVFNGTSQYIDLVDGLGDYLGGGFTFTFWAYPQTATNWARFISFNNGAGDENLFFTRIGTSTTLRLDVFQGGVVDAPNALQLNTWQMFSATLDQDGSAVIYKNGVPIATGTIGLPNEVERLNNWLGRSGWSGDALYRGRLDDFRFYNYALSPAEIATFYTNIRTTEYICVPEPDNPLIYDFTGDCRIGLDDFAEIAELWLECLRVPDEKCDL